MTSPKYIIIKDEDNDELAKMELQIAMELIPKYILIEPFQLGDLSVRWIKTGNFLHKVSVVAGVAAIGLLYSNKHRWIFYVPLTTISLLSAITYDLSSGDLYCKYQVEKGTKCLEKLPIHELSCSNPVVLVKRDDTMRKFLHNTVALTALFVSGLKIYHWF